MNVVVDELQRDRERERARERMSRMLKIGPEVKGGEKRLKKQNKWNTLLLLSSHSGLQSFLTEEREKEILVHFEFFYFNIIYFTK